MSTAQTEARAIARYAIRYDARGEYEHPSGDFVHYADHVAALAAKDAELAEAQQRYVDANKARIDAEAQLAEARKALEPFAKACARAEAGNAHFGGIHAKDVPDSQKYGVLGVTWGHLRAARRALAGGKEE